MSKKPLTVEKMITDIKALLAQYPDSAIPHGESIIPTHSFFLDFCERLIALERQVNNE